MSYILNVEYSIMDDIAEQFDLVRCVDSDSDTYYERDDVYFAADTEDYYADNYDLEYCGECGSWVTRRGWNDDQNCCDHCTYYPDYIRGYHDDKWKQVDMPFVKWNDSEPDAGIGIELEVENIDSSLRNRDDDARRILHEYITSGMTRCEEDSSLTDGFEIITDKHTKKAFYNILLPQIKSALDFLLRAGYRSHDGGNCGLHLHFSRKLLGDEYKEQEQNIQRLVDFYDKNAAKISAIARRGYTSYCRKNTSKDCGHGYTINNGDYTVEFRQGRGTLNYRSLKAWIDFHWCLVELITQKDFRTSDFERVVNAMTDEQSKSYIYEKLHFEINDDYIQEVM